MNTLFKLLPREIQSNIYQYDGTFKEKMSKEVLLELWKTKWIYYFNSIKCPYHKFMLNYLFMDWGIWDDETNGEKSDIYKNLMFPDDISVHIRETRIGIVVRVDKDDENLFDGWILDEYDYREKIWLEYDHVLNMMEVYEDKEQGMYLYVRIHDF